MSQVARAILLPGKRPITLPKSGPDKHKEPQGLFSSHTARPGPARAGRVYFVGSHSIPPLCRPPETAAAPPSRTATAAVPKRPLLFRQGFARELPVAARRDQPSVSPGPDTGHPWHLICSGQLVWCCPLLFLGVVLLLLLKLVPACTLNSSSRNARIQSSMDRAVCSVISDRALFQTSCPSDAEARRRTSSSRTYQELGPTTVP